jgi:hypothetical protein
MTRFEVEKSRLVVGFVALDEKLKGAKFDWIESIKQIKVAA